MLRGYPVEVKNMDPGINLPELIRVALKFSDGLALPKTLHEATVHMLRTFY